MSRLRQWAAGPAGTVRLPLVWGFSEATLFFIVPDVAILLAALTGWRNGLQACLWALLGALVGGTLVYFFPGTFQPWHAGLPGISQGMLDQVRDQVAAHGPWAMVNAPWEGIPYKLYAAELGATHAGYPLFLLFSTVARLERFLPVVLAGWLGFWLLRDPFARRPRLYLALFIVLWAVIYAAYFLAIRGRYGSL